MTGWLSLFTASLFEVAWTFSLKYLDLKKITSLRWLNLFSDKQSFFIIAPLLGYIVFGIGNIIFFSMALKQIPASTAFAVWMAVALAGIKIVDISVLKQPVDAFQLFYFVLIIIGVIGLKRTL